MFPVSPEKAQALRARLARLGVREADLDEQFVRSGGHGGQNVNKVATCVVLRHAPSGIVVRCQESRTQGMNRFLARRLLCERLEERLAGAASKARQEAERIRRQKRRRSRRAKAKMLADKRAHAEKKDARRPVRGDD
jgi:protein subunit release factor B